MIVLKLREAENAKSNSSYCKRSLRNLLLWVAISMVLLLPAARADWVTTKYTQGWQIKDFKRDGSHVSETMRLHQGAFSEANDLHFKIWQKEDDVEVLDWDVKLLDGTTGNVTSTRGSQPDKWSNRVDKLHWRSNPDEDNGSHAIDVDITGLTIPYCSYIELQFDWDLTEYNTKRLWDTTWTKTDAGGNETDREKAGPSHGWSIADPVFDSGTGIWHHQFCFQNDDPDDTITLSGLMFIPLSTFSNDFTGKTWSPALSGDIHLAPGEFFCYDIQSSFPAGFIAGQYELRGSGVWLQDVFLHETPEPASMLLFGTAIIGAIGFTRKRLMR